MKVEFTVLYSLSGVFIEEIFIKAAPKFFNFCYLSYYFRYQENNFTIEKIDFRKVQKQKSFNYQNRPKYGYMLFLSKNKSNLVR